MLELLQSYLSPEMVSFVMIVAIDIVMSGDNAIIIGMAAAGLPPELRKKAIIYGIAVATVLRIVFALTAFKLLSILGLTLAGGLLLAWVCWQMWQELRGPDAAAADAGAGGDSGDKEKKQPKTLRMAMTNIIVADVSMSLDNVLAVAGAAGDHFEMLIFGLVLSVALMAFAANAIAGLLERHKWIGYIGLAIVAYVALDMIWRGSGEVWFEMSVLMAGG